MLWVPEVPVLSRINCIVLIACGLLLAAQGGEPPQRQESVGPGKAPQPVDEAMLKSQQIELTAAGIQKYLAGIWPAKVQKEDSDRLIEQLGSDSFAVREQATAKLLAMPIAPIGRLKAALRSPDAEIRARAGSILTKIEQRLPPEALMFAAFRMIQVRKISGLAPELLGVVPLCEKQPVRLALQQAMRVTARPVDIPHLQKALTSKDVEVRIAAIAGLAGVAGNASDFKWMKELANSKQPEPVQLVLATEMVNCGDRQGLRILARLLSSDNKEIRHQSGDALRSATGEDFAFDPDDPQRNGNRQLSAGNRGSKPRAISSRRLH
jgi:HEAT repeat protein